MPQQARTNQLATGLGDPSVTAKVAPGIRAFAFDEDGRLKADSRPCVWAGIVSCRASAWEGRIGQRNHDCCSGSAAGDHGWVADGMAVEPDIGDAGIQQ